MGRSLVSRSWVADLMRFVLASASPRRIELLQQVGFLPGKDFRAQAADIDETPFPDEAPGAYVRRMAAGKARTVCERLRATASDQNAILLPILAADTSVVLDGSIFGKPEGEGEALAMLRALSGRCHRVLSAVAVCARQEQALVEHCVLSETRVWFAELNENDCRQYWATGEPVDKAGAYGIQGRGGAFVRSIEGSYSGVVGLPLVETLELLNRFGIGCWNA